MIGLRASVRGLSFLNESPIAGMTILRSNSEVDARFLTVSTRRPESVESAGLHREMLDHRAERERREVDEAAGDHDDADEEADE
jgi:hypothetical protein